MHWVMTVTPYQQDIQPWVVNIHDLDDLVAQTQHWRAQGAKVRVEVLSMARGAPPPDRVVPPLDNILPGGAASNPIFDPGEVKA